MKLQLCTGGEKRSENRTALEEFPIIMDRSGKNNHISLLES